MEVITPHVLIVDDDADSCAVTQAMLKTGGFRVTCTTSPTNALNLAAEKRFDAILLDHWMPVLTGISLCREIRLVDENTPIVFLSAAAYDTDKADAFAAGAQHYLTKPVDLERLVDVMHSVTSGPA